MKPEPVTPEPPQRPGEAFYARTFALVTLALLTLLLYQILQTFFVPLAWALFISFLLYPVHSWLVKKLRGRANVSAALLTAATLLLLVGPLTALGAAFAAQVAELLQYAQRFAAERGPTDVGDLFTVPVVGTFLAWLQDYFGVTLAQIQGWFLEGARTVLQFLGTLGRQVFLGALGTLFGFILTMFMLFFIIRDGQYMLGTLRALIPMSPEHKARLFEHLASVMRAMVFGTGVTALLQGILIAIGFAIAGLPSPIVFGVLASLLALVPLMGTPVVWVPAVIVLVMQERWIAAVFLLIWGGFVSTFDNILRPILVSGRAQVATLTVFIGVLGGVTAFGPVGVFVGPLVLALVIALIRFAIEVRQASGH